MATTVRNINELLEETLVDITTSKEAWLKFLKSASMNYKYNFTEQLSIYAQRPNAVACAAIDIWNNVFNRYVNKNCPGIGLLTERNGYPAIKYVWDINDTHGSYGKQNKKVEIWKVSKIYEKSIINLLENKFGSLTESSDFIETVKSLAVILVDNNISSYRATIEDSTFKTILNNNVAYMIINRCGIDPSPYFDVDNLFNVKEFEDYNNVVTIGTAISDISQIGISEIYQSLKNVRESKISKIRTFERNNNILYDDSVKEKNVEGSDLDESNIQKSRGLSSTKSNSEERGAIQSRQILNDEVELSKTRGESTVSTNVVERDTTRTLAGDRRNITEESKGNNRENEEITWNNRRIEREQSNEVDRSNEQHQERGRGNSVERSSLQLDDYVETDNSHYVIVDEKINQILSKTPYLKSPNKYIINYFNQEKERDKRAEYLKDIFNTDVTEIIVDDTIFSYRAYNNGVLFWKDDFETKGYESFVNWNDLVDYYDAMILLKQLKNNDQLSITEESAEELEFTQEFIDRYLQELHIESKYMIYEQFSKSLSSKENTDFLKELYGTGGVTSVLHGSGIGANYDTKGLTFNRGYPSLDKSGIEKFFTWNKISKSIEELINKEQFLTSDELDNYSNWLEHKEQEDFSNQLPLFEENEETLAEKINSFLKDYDITSYNNNYREFDSEQDVIEEINKQINSPDNIRVLIEYLKSINSDIEVSDTDKETVTDLIKELNNIFPSYQYKVGDIATIGTNKYEILSISDNEVTLYDFDAPLFNQIYSIEEFENKIKDNPANDFMLKQEDNDIGEYNDEEYRKKYEVEYNTQITFNDTEKQKLDDKSDNLDVDYIDDVVINRNPTPVVRKRKNTLNYVLHPEVPYDERINYKIRNNDIGYGTPKERYKNNIEAIKVLKKCEEENRYATPEEQEVLINYVGWGGISEAFDVRKWENEYQELKSLLTPKEYKEARDTVLTAFYTPPIVVKAMYKALSNMGLEKGNILEPSCGIGNFIGLLPNNDKLKIFGVEKDGISGRIARQLYQKSSIAIQGFEEVNYSNSFFDVAIGNVPFGTEKLNDKKYDKYNFLIHDYFFAKTIDKVRPGGVIAFITSKGTMDKEDTEVRKYIAQRADLLGAIRLPNNTFKDSAGTKVTSDIIFLQKRDSITDIMPDWIDLDTNENGISMNKYFVEHPEMVLGNMQMIKGQHGILTSSCVPYDNERLEDLLDNAISNINAKIEDYEIDNLEEDEEDLSIEADPNVRNFSFSIIDDKIYYRENSRMYPREFSETTEKRVRGLIELRDITRELINQQLDNYSDEEIEKTQQKLNDVYDKFTKKYDLINSKGNYMAFNDDDSYFLLCSLEILDNEGNLKRKADIFTKRTIGNRKKDRVVESARDALLISISDKARVDISYMQSLCNISMDKMLSDLEGEIFNVPEYGEANHWVTADEYLSGNVREKLKVAEEFAKEDSRFNINVEYLKKVIPKDIPPTEISVRLGATWIPENYVKEFIFELLDSSYDARDNIEIHYSNLTSEWNIENKRYDRYSVPVTSTYGTSRVNAYRLLEDTLNLRDTKVFDYVIDEETGNKKPVLNKQETAIAQAKQDKIKQKFSEWVWRDIDRREYLTKLYNEKFNSIRSREFDGSNISFEGMNPEITLRKHQVNAIARILYGGNTLLAHEVGAGKTFEMVAAAMESKRLGLCNKSLFVVPNHIIEQFASEFLQLYPSANILVSTKKDFETKNRKKFCSKIATGDYDAIIIGHSQFEKIPMSVERQIAILEKQLEEITNGIIELKEKNDESFSIKMLVRTQKSIEKKLEKLNTREKKDNVVTFEELGVDRLFVDEAHYYKNLYFYTKMNNVSGLPQTDAQKSSDLYMKCRYLDELTGSKGVIFATGTPVSNSMAELYTMQRYLQYDTLLKYNLQHFDAWASTFGETVTAMEIAPEGTGYRQKTRFAKFYNLPELMTMFKEVADIQTADMLNLPVPKANYENIVLKPSDIQLDLIKSFAERAEKVRARSVNPTEDNMLKITNDGRKLSLDQRLINPLLPDNEDSKVKICSDKVYEIWENNKDKRLTQLIFCDLSTPKNDGSFNVYDDMKEKLIAKGVPEDEIQFIHNANTEVKKKALFSKVRNGEVRALMGSTQKMGAGTNCQDRLIAIHDLDCPWRPSDLTQRSGRIIRQGNQNDEVYIYRYVTEKTFDAYLYQTVQKKQEFISQVMTSKTPVRVMEDIDEVALSYAEIKALAAGNPLIIEKTELDTQVSKLKLLKQSYLNEKYKLEDKVKNYYPNQIKKLENNIVNYQKDIDSLNDFSNNTDDKFSPMIINGIEYTDKKLAGQMLIEQCKNYTGEDYKEIGEYEGFKLELKFYSFTKEYNLYLSKNGSYMVALGDSELGNITRIDNVLDSISNRLSDAKKELEDNKIQLERAKIESEKPFSQEQELKEKIKRLNKVNQLLSIDEVEKVSNNSENKENYER